MASDRFQRRIDRLMDQIEEAADQRDWQNVEELANDVLLADAGNSDAQNFLALAERARSSSPTAPPQASTAATEAAPATHPRSFADGRYQVKRFLGEGGKKKVYLAHDTLLDREVALALIKTEGLDEAGRSRSNGKRRPWAGWAPIPTSSPFLTWAKSLRQTQSRTSPTCSPS